MLSSWLDRWDERKAIEDEDQKLTEPLEIGASLAFPGAGAATSLAALREHVTANCASSDKFYSVDTPISDFTFREGVLKFSSSIRTETEENDVVHARVLTGSKRRNALIIVPHLNAGPDDYASFAKHLQLLGPTVVVLTLPYHGERSRKGGGAIATY